MKYKSLEKAAKKELAVEKKQIAVAEIKDRLREIASAERVLKKLKKQYTELLKGDV